MPVEEFESWVAYYGLEAKWKEEALEKAKRDAERNRSGGRGRSRRR